jgi:protocatechuate 3,4-dioxygenase, alpha subunit
MSERPEGITPSQTVGPFFAYALTPLGRYRLGDLAGSDLVTDDAVGERIRIAGRLLDGDGAPVADGMIEIWQADGQGRFAHPLDARGPRNSAFKGFGRTPTDEEGRWSFATVKPGRVPGPDGVLQAPHVSVAVFARGMLRHVLTRIYFEDEPANGEDPILARVPPERRATLIARKDGGAYAFDIRLQGDGETVFFEA